MANPHEILGQLIRSSSEAAIFQKEKLTELSTKDFPFPDSRSFLEPLISINGAIISRFDEFRKEFDGLIKQNGSEESFLDLHDSIILHTGLLWSVNSLVHYVQQTAREYVSQSTVILVSHLTKQFGSQHLFDWNVSSQNDFSKLKKFLVERFGIKLSSVRPKISRETIQFQSKEKIQILLDENGLRAFLRIRDKSIYEFICKKKGNTVSVYSRKSIFLLTPITESNFQYSDIGTRLKKWIQVFPDQGKILSLLPDNMSLLSFPDIYRDNIVANVLLAHEVGHFMVNVKHLVSKINIKIDKDMLDAYLKKNISNEEGIDKKKTISDSHWLTGQKLKSLVYDSIKNWIEELLCDMIAFRLSGPVFVFGMADLLLTHGKKSTLTNDYPHISYRLSHIISEIERMGFVERVTDKKYRKSIGELINKIKSFLNLPDEQDNNNIIFDENLPQSLKDQQMLFKVVLKAVENSLKDINKIANEITKGLQYTSEKFGNDMSVLIPKLDDKIPPSETEGGKPADIISILNAGIIYKMTWRLSGKYDSSTIEAIQDTEKSINSLVLHAIESTSLQKILTKES